MRAIKFRGLSKKYNQWLYGQWLYGYFFKYPNGRTVIYESDSSCWEVHSSSVGQYTGLKDADGKEIYEGDIISQNGDIIGIICFSPRYGVSVKKNSTTWSLVNFCIDSDFDSGILSDVEVIGNIHDNKDLIK